MNSYHRSLTSSNGLPCKHSLLCEKNVFSKVGKWEQEEDDLLSSLIYQFGEKNWKPISDRIPGRSPIQCLHRWTKILRPGLVKGHWDEREDKMLRRWVKQEGPTRWSECAEFINGRTGKQCRERWFNVLNPTVLKGNWTSTEDFVIFYVYNSIGSKWAEINKILPNRTENSIKNRFYSSLRSIVLENEKAKNRTENQKSMKLKFSTKDMIEHHFSTAYSRKVVHVQEEAEKQGEEFNQEKVLKSINEGLEEYLASNKKELEPLEEENAENSVKCVESSEKCADSVAQVGSVSGFDCYFDPQNCFDFDTVSLYKFDESQQSKDTSIYEKQLDKHLKQIQAMKVMITNKYRGYDEIVNDSEFKRDVMTDFLNVKEDLKAINRSLATVNGVK